MYLRPFKSTALVVVMAAITWGVPAIAESVSASSVSIQSSECAPGVTPNVVGQVTDVDESPYPTRVELRGTRQSPAAGWGEEVLGSQEAGASGTFAFCFDVFTNSDVLAIHVVAYAQSSDFASIGHTPSEFSASSQCLQSACRHDIQMAEPTIRFDIDGQVSSVRIEERLEGGQFRPLLVSSLNDQNEGAFVLRIPSGTALSIRVNPVESDRLTLIRELTFAGSTLDVSEPLPVANFYGRLKKDTGEYFESNDSQLTMYIARLHGDNCAPNMGTETLSNNGCIGVAQFSDPGHFAAALSSDGLWAISLAGEGYAVTTAYFILADGQYQILDNGPVAVTDSGIEVTISTGTMKFVVHDSQGNPLVIDSLQAFRLREDGNYEGFYGGPARLSTTRFGWTPTGNNTFRIDVTAGPMSTAVYFKVANYSTQPTVEATCSYVSGAPGVTTCDGDPLLRDDAQNWIITMPAGDIGFQMCGPGTQVESCGQLGSDPYFLARAVLSLDQNGNLWEGPPIELNLRGSVVQLNLPDPVDGGTVYRFRFMPPWSNPNRWASVPPFDLRVNGDGSIDRCGSVQTGVLCASPTPVALVSGIPTWPELLRFETGNFEARVTRGDCVSSCAVPYAGAQVFAVVGNEVRFLVNESSSSEGRFTAHMPEGTYLVKAYPDARASADGYTEISIRIVVNASGAVSSVNGVAHDGNDELELVLPAANVNGRLLKDGQPVARRVINIAQWVEAEGKFEYRPIWPFTDLDGSFKTTLGEGVWQLTAYPDETLTDYSKDQIVVRVTSGSISEAGPCVLDPAQTCTNVSEGIVLSYGSANLKGVVRRVDPSNQSLVPVALSGVGVRVFDSSAGHYRGVEGGGTTSTGSFGFTVEPGRYLLDISKPNGVSGASSTTVYVVVTEDGMCEAASASQTTCPSTVGSLDITLPSPNLTGTVVAGGSGKRAFIRVVKWVDGRWKWEEATFDRSSLPNGNFELSLNDGQYQMIVEPDAASSSGLSQTVKYVEVSGNTWCSFEPIGEAPPAIGQCPSMGSGPLVVELPASNYSGVVVDVSGGGSNPVRFGRVEVFRVYGQNDAFSEFLQSSNISYNGQFDLRIEYPDTGPNAVDVIDLVVHPEASGSNTLARKKIRLWLGRFDGGGDKDDLCTAEPVNGNCDNNNLVTGSQTIQVNAGNLRGTVVRPGSGLAVGFSGVQAERIDGGGSPTDRYRWINVGVSGQFSADLEEGEWRLTARPPRGESSLSAGSIDIKVKGDLTWCTLESFNDVGDQCTAPSPFQIALTVPNVTSRVMNGSSGQQDVWVNVEVRRTVGNNSWWEWVSVGASTGTNGDFALSLPDGTYRLAVNPPFGNSQGLVRFTREFTVTSGVSNLPVQLSYPTANLVRTIRNPSGETVPRAWVYVEQLVGGNWQWADINGETSAAGVISLNIASSGRYRLVVNPPNGSLDLARFTQEFEVTVQSNSLTFVGPALPDTLAFSRPNISGSVTTDGTNLSRNGWVEVFELDGTWVTGSGTGEGGSFALLAPAPISGTKTYTVRLHPNYQSAVRSPIDVRVTIDATGAITKWWYASDTAEVDRCTSTPCSMSVNLSFDPPNVAVRVETTGSQAIEGAFVRFEALTGTSGSPTGVVFETVSDENGEVSLRLPFANNGTTYYKVTVVRVVGDSVSTEVSEISVDASTSTGNPVVVQFQ